MGFSYVRTNHACAKIAGNVLQDLMSSDCLAVVLTICYCDCPIVQNSVIKTISYKDGDIRES